MGNIVASEESPEYAEQITRRLSILGILLRDNWNFHAGKWSVRPWNPYLLKSILKGVEDLANAMGGDQSFRTKLGKLSLGIGNLSGCAGITQPSFVGLSNVSITFNERFETWGDPPEWTVTHELGHAWDFQSRKANSNDMRIAVGAYRKGGDFATIRHWLDRENPAFWYWPGESPPPCGYDRNFNSMEDFAEAVAASLYPDIAKARAIRNQWPYDPFIDFASTPRGQFIRIMLTE